MMLLLDFALALTNGRGGRKISGNHFNKNIDQYILRSINMVKNYLSINLVKSQWSMWPLHSRFDNQYNYSLKTGCWMLMKHYDIGHWSREQ